jgi:non-ribosomal peptide synthetase component F
MVLLAALDIVLARWTGCLEVVVGTLVANRPTAAAGGMLGAHYNVALLRGSLAGDPCLGELILRVVESTLPALDRQELPFAAVAATLAAGLGIDPAAVPAAVLQVDRYPLHALRLQGATVGGLHLDEEGAGRLADLAAPRGVPAAASCAPLTFFVREAPGGVTLSLFYHPAAIGHLTATRLLDAYLTALGALTGPLDLPALALDLDLGFDLPDRPSGPAAGGLSEATAVPGRGPEMTVRGGPAPGGARLLGTSGTPAAPRFLSFTTGSPVAALSPIVTCGPAVPLGPAADQAEVVCAAAAGRRAPALPAALRPPASTGS